MIKVFLKSEFEFIIKFRLSEKHTKFEKNLPHLLSKRQNHEEIFFQIMCASQKVRTLKRRFFQKLAEFEICH